MITKNDIKHGFHLRAHDLVSLFDDTNKISTFMNKLENQALIDTARYDRDKYVGDGFEYLVEILINSHAYDNRLGITNYTPIQTDDNGVDGVGINISDKKCVIQIKYRANSQSFLTATKDHLDSMFTEGMITHGVMIPDVNSLSDKKVAHNHYVITTASGLHHYTDVEKFQGFVKCIGFDDLKAMLDGNMSFWNLCRDIAKGFYPTAIPIKPKRKSRKIVNK